MAVQIISSFALSVPLNIGGGAIFQIIQRNNGILDDKNEPIVNKIITCTIFGLFTGVIPSLAFEMSRIGLNRFAPKLLSSAPSPLAFLARVVAHLAAPFLGALIIRNCPENWEENLEIFLWNVYVSLKNLISKV